MERDRRRLPVLAGEDGGEVVEQVERRAVRVRYQRGGEVFHVRSRDGWMQQWRRAPDVPELE